MVLGFTPGLPQGSALSLFNVYTAGITSNQFGGRGRTLTFSDDVLLNNRAVKDEMPKVFFDNKEINRVHVLPT